MLLGSIECDQWRTVFVWFQRAPTLGGECYEANDSRLDELTVYDEFQRAPTLGGECYTDKCSAHQLMEELVFQ